jgi:hypothetical protein
VPIQNLLGKAVRKALDGARVKPGAVVMGVPRAQVILRTLGLPASDNLGELASMVHLQIGKDLPFRKDDAVIDFRVRPLDQVAPPPPIEGAPLISSQPCRSWKCSWLSHNSRSSIFIRQWRALPV